ncbi:hypothetical protein BDZ97DRAFT_1620132, partial [Flammula alnicola]
YARPSPRAPTAAYPIKLHHEEEYQMTAELLADIERADQVQQTKSVLPGHPYPYPSAPRGESPSSAKGLNVERVRGSADRASPSNPENGQQRGRREQQLARESPKNRDHPSASPSYPPFSQTQAQSHTPERRMSPGQHSPVVVPGEPHPASYLAQYNSRESPPVMRRPGNSEPRLNVSMASQTPPLQTIAARTPDRSLPVQEEDEVMARNGAGARANWQVKDQNSEPQFHSSSPTPPSDLNPDNNNQRFDNTTHNNQLGHRDEDKSILKHEESHAQYAERDSTEEDSYTPRSPTAGLPEDDHEVYYPGQNIPIRNPVPVALRAKVRNGSTDHLMRGLDSALLDQSADAPPQEAQAPERPPQYSDQRQGSQSSATQYQNYPPRPEYGYTQDHQQNGNGRYHPPQVYPDDFQSYGEDSTAAYIQSYLHSPRPDAPIPPTPHSQTAAPSPSPLLSGYGVGKELPLYRPIRAAGSPYPFPFNHVRRNRQVQGQRFLPSGLEPPTLTEQVARQWQVFAQNNQGNITDSTLSPSSTPFQGDLFDHWAYLHTQRMMRGGMLDTASMQSSPSHQPIPLPLPPNLSIRKKDRGLHSKRQSYSRKPPPRVDSTQPRETSPELSSSGEETAGEERPGTAAEHIIIGPAPASVVSTEITEVDDNGDWVDEDDEDDYEDLIDLEYHPAFVRNISKRRRKWEVGWENLIQAFQALDRQTDATMVLLASPSHTTKLHALRSRSIRRQPILASSVSMNQIRSGFSHIAAQRRATRPDKSSLVDRLMVSSSSSGGDGSDGSSASVEENLRRALDAALGSLGAMGEVYEQREARVLEELQRSREDRERVELLLRQVLG